MYSTKSTDLASTIITVIPDKITEATLTYFLQPVAGVSPRDASKGSYTWDKKFTMALRTDDIAESSRLESGLA